MDGYSLVTWITALVTVRSGSCPWHLALLGQSSDHEIILRAFLCLTCSTKGREHTAWISVHWWPWNIGSRTMGGWLCEREDLFLYTVVSLSKLHGSFTCAFQLVTSLTFVLAIAQLRIFCEKTAESLFKQVHFWEENLGIALFRVLLDINGSVEVTHARPQLWGPLLAEFAVENQDGVRLHEVSEHGII